MAGSTTGDEKKATASGTPSPTTVPSGDGIMAASDLDRNTTSSPDAKEARVHEAPASFSSSTTGAAAASSQLFDKEDDLELNPVDDLKRRLSMWGESAASRAREALYYPAPGDDEDEDEHEGQEYELLLDPNLPEEYIPSFRDVERDSASFDDDTSTLKGEKRRRKGKSKAKKVKSKAASDNTPTASATGSAVVSDDTDDDGDEVEDSPYPEVRAAVRNYDEDVPCNTVRAWVIGMTLVIIGASMNTLFSLRSPSISIGTLVAQIIAWPMGHAWAKVMPRHQFTTLGLKWSLNPGPFNIKEHSIIVVMAGVSFSVAYATDIILAQIVFYKQDFGIVFQLLLVISTQSLGYGIAGLMRKFLGMSFLSGFLTCSSQTEANPQSTRLR